MSSVQRFASPAWGMGMGMQPRLGSEKRIGRATPVTPNVVRGYEGTRESGACFGGTDLAVARVVRDRWPEMKVNSKVSTSTEVLGDISARRYFQNQNLRFWPPTSYFVPVVGRAR